ncbi:prolyl aminopeptidase [Vulgatibacter incomptus]|nr:prolyl aminopeptidase [Vulgatibacter incomptus]
MVHPAIEPTETGMLDVGDGQLVYWEASGNPNGKPALALHSGPGVGSSPGRRRAFASAGYRLVQFDQRGCGRSTPSVSDPSVGLEHNTTHHLIDDIERLREHLGIERWLVWGASWGTTLALAYAQRFPQRVSELVLLSVTLARPSDVHWLYHEAGRFFPAEWARFREGAPEGDRHDLVAAYDRLLNEQPDPEVRAKAAADWCAWEDAVLSLEEGWKPWDRFSDPAFRMTFARLCAHYFSNAAWLGEDELLRNMGRLAGIPGVLIHGRFDIQGPCDMPWLVAQAWPGAELELLPVGHSGGEAMMARMVEALARFAPGSR